MRTRLTLCQINRRTNPIAQCTTRILADPVSSEGRPFMFTVKNMLPTTLMSSLRFIGGGAILSGQEKVGKSYAFQILGGELPIEMSVMKSYPGKPPVRRVFYMVATPAAPQTSIWFRCGTGEVHLAQGPLRMLTSSEAAALFGGHFKATMQYRAADAQALGLRIVAEASKEVIVQKATIDDLGMETTVAVRRRRRNMGL